MAWALQLSVQLCHGRAQRGSGGSRTAPWADGFSALQDPGPMGSRSQGEALRAASAVLALHLSLVGGHWGPLLLYWAPGTGEVTGRASGRMLWDEAWTPGI